MNKNNKFENISRVTAMFFCIAMVLAFVANIFTTSNIHTSQSNVGGYYKYERVQISSVEEEKISNDIAIQEWAEEKMYIIISASVVGVAIVLVPWIIVSKRRKSHLVKGFASELSKKNNPSLKSK